MNIINFTKRIFISIFIFLLFILLTTSCHKKKEAFLFYNPDYYYVYNEENKIYKSVKKKLNRNFYQVNELFFESFTTLSDTLKKKLNNKRNCLFYINDFLTPLLLKDNLLPADHNFKLLTYNLPLIETNLNNFSIFNINIDTLILKEKILKFIKRFLKKENFSDCGILVNTNYSFPFELISSLKQDNLKIDILEIDKLDDKMIKDWLNEKKLKVVFLFGYEFNTFILNLDKNEFNNIIFLEFETKYGELSNKIKYSIHINWDLTVNDALVSKKLKEFLDKEDKELEITRYDYLVKNKNVILIEKYKKIKKYRNL